MFSRQSSTKVEILACKLMNWKVCVFVVGSVRSGVSVHPPRNTCSRTVNNNHQDMRSVVESAANLLSLAPADEADEAANEQHVLTEMTDTLVY